MEFVKGRIITDTDMKELPPDERRQAYVMVPLINSNTRDSANGIYQMVLCYRGFGLVTLT